MKDGELVTRCLANTLEDEKDGNGNRQEMISGAIESAETFAFTYGKVEARLKTKPLIGNFPAFWMMPLDNSAGWPAGGEIDIWEQIDGQSISYHTIHSKWANGAGDGGLGNNYNPPKSGSHRTTNGEYHTFGLEWKENVLIWFVDGEQVFSYAKSDSQDDLDKGQWPFDKPFYLILNQSVGNGSWAMNYDKRFVYETVFDYVRVYQKEGQTNTSINDLKNKADRLDFYPSPGRILIVSPERQAVSVTDIEGRIHFEKEVQGNRTIRLPKGVYILNGRKAIVP